MRKWARRLKQETIVLVLALQDRRTPWYARVVVAAVAAYALSPIDLIPDFIPVLGQLDDLLLVPLGIALARRLIPPAVLFDCRVRAMGGGDWGGGRVAAAIIVFLWIAGVGGTLIWAWGGAATR